MQDCLKMFELWTYIDNQATKSSEVIESKSAAWKAQHDKACTALYLIVKKNLYNNIEEITNAFEAWTLLETNFKPQGFGFFNDIFQRLLNFILADCQSFADYIP